MSDGNHLIVVIIGALLLVLFLRFQDGGERTNWEKRHGYSQRDR